MMVNRAKHNDSPLSIRSETSHDSQDAFHYETLEPRSIGLLDISEPIDIHSSFMYELIIADQDVAPKFTALPYTWDYPFQRRAIPVELSQP